MQEVVYHLVAAVLLLIASILYIINVNSAYRAYYKGKAYNCRLAAGVSSVISEQWI